VRAVSIAFSESTAFFESASIAFHRPLAHGKPFHFLPPRFDVAFWNCARRDYKAMSLSPDFCLVGEFFAECTPLRLLSLNSSNSCNSLNSLSEATPLPPCKPWQVAAASLLQGGKNDSAAGAVIWFGGNDPVLCPWNRVGCSVSNLIQSERFGFDPRL